MSGLVNVQIDGFDQLVEKLTKLGNPRTTRRAMIAVHRPVLRPVVTAYRNEVPERSPVIKSGPRAGKRQHQKNQYGSLPNLKKSVGIITGKDPVNVRMYVGLRAGKSRKNDGWYGRLVHYGFKTRDGQQVPGNPFKERAWAQTKAPATQRAISGVQKALNKQIEKLSK